MTCHDKAELTGMSSFPLSLIPQSNSRAGMDNRGILYNETILMKASDITARICQLDLVDLIGIEPDLSLTTFEHRGRKAFLKLERDYTIIRG